MCINIIIVFIFNGYFVSKAIFYIIIFKKERKPLLLAEK